MSTYTWVAFSFEAAHADPRMGHPGIHGHSYMVKVWFRADEPWNAEDLRTRCETQRQRLDHTMLNEATQWREPLDPPTMEVIAQWLGKMIPGCVIVDVERPSLGFGARWTTFKQPA